MSEDELAELHAEEERLAAQIAEVRRRVEELRAELHTRLTEWCRLDEALDEGPLREEVKALHAELERIREDSGYRWGRVLSAPLRELDRLRDRARLWTHGVPPLDPPQTPRPFTKYTDHGAYHWTFAAELPWYRRRTRAVCDWVRPDFRCLDLGCGDGALTYAVAQRCRRVVGVDADAEAIHLARAELDQRGASHVELIEGRFADVADRLSGERFDLVYAMDCIEHLEDPAELLDLVRATVAPDGLVVIGTPLFVNREEVSEFHTRELTRAQLDGLLLPHFRRVYEQLLPHPSPRTKQLRDRFYVFYGRPRSWRRLWL